MDALDESSATVGVSQANAEGESSEVTEWVGYDYRYLKAEVYIGYSVCLYKKLLWNHTHV